MALDEDYSADENNQGEDIVRTIESNDSEYKMILLDDTPIGYVRVDFMDRKQQMVWLRFALGEKRGHGYTKSAMKMYIQELFMRNVSRIECKVYAYNKPSINLLESIGFVKEGSKRKAHLYQNELYDIHAYGLLSSDYRIPSKE